MSRLQRDWISNRCATKAMAQNLSRAVQGMRGQRTNSCRITVAFIDPRARSRPCNACKISSITHHRDQLLIPIEIRQHVGATLAASRQAGRAELEKDI
jgi:hypothetical protein